MGKSKSLTKHLNIRITEIQFKKLFEVIIEEKKNKSEVIRNSIDYYLDKSCRISKNGTF